MTTEHSIQTLSLSDLQSMMKEDPDIRLIDVLPPDHFEKVHLPGSQNVCVFYMSFLDDVSKVLPDKDARVVVYGASKRSHDAKMAFEKLARAGYSNVSVFGGGIEAYREAGLKLEGNETEQLIDGQTTLLLTDGTYAVDTESSSIRWEGRNPSTSHFGTVGFSKGEITVEGGKLGGMIEVDMNSIHNVNLEGDELQPVLEAHLKSDDFFFTSMFPKAVLVLKEVAPLSPQWQTAANFHVKGELTLRGVTAVLEFDMTASQADNALQLEAHFDLDRTRWNIIYGSTRFFEHLGMHKVFDLISLQIRIAAHK